MLRRAVRARPGRRPAQARRDARRRRHPARVAASPSTAPRCGARRSASRTSGARTGAWRRPSAMIHAGRVKVDFLATHFFGLELAPRGLRDGGGPQERGHQGHRHAVTGGGSPERRGPVHGSEDMMNEGLKDDFGTPFERIFVGIVAIATGLSLALPGRPGPAHPRRHRLQDRARHHRPAHRPGRRQPGPDEPDPAGRRHPALCSAGPWPSISLIATPLFLIYYALSYTIGWEWSSPSLRGQQRALVLPLPRSSSSRPSSSCSTRWRSSPRTSRAGSGEGGLAAYSAVFVLFLHRLRRHVAEGGPGGRRHGNEPRLRHRPGGLLAGPGLRPRLLHPSGPHQRLSPVGPAEAGLSGRLPVLRLLLHPDRRPCWPWASTMFLTKDPTFLWRDLVVFAVLAAIIAFGFFYVRKNYRAR
ncbi:MAG: hypothetical protein M0C28_12830 [Candidatus Moduliflexus flocculans]|nr:hypothetical protein [Candidatus Moduliflexus flocculans]